jgi:hypothetical protein
MEFFINKTFCNNVYLPFTKLHTHIPLMLYPEWAAEASRIFLRDVHVLPKLFSYEEYCRRDRR